VAEFVKIGSISMVPEGTMQTIRISGKRIALAHVEGEFFAIDDTCSHAQCSLGTSGFLDGSAVICGCHGAQFDVTTGDVLSLPATQPVGSYVVKITGEDIYIEV
jgi:3-phenylpropionate/trans-cinnamate dioxygenase ferredoxin component